VKTLALFAIICLGLLTLAAWHLASIRGVDVSVAPPSSPAGHDERATPPVVRVGGAFTTANESSEHGDGDASRIATDVAGAAVDGPPATVTTPSAVRWAGDDDRDAAKQRFIGLRGTLADDPYNQTALEAALELARRLEWPNEACDLLVRLVRLRPDDVALRFELAVQLMRLERWIEALSQLRFVVERQPDNAHAWYNLAIAHQALGHLRDARATWDRVIELLPANPDAYAHRGELLLDLSAWQAAATDFETTLRIEPGSLDATMNLSLALTELGRVHEARDALLPMLEHHPVYVPLLNRLAEISWTLYQTNPAANKALAEETLEYCTRSLVINDNQPDIQTLYERAAQVTN
jgi:predicted Zn-dependent protease